MSNDNTVVPFAAPKLVTPEVTPSNHKTPNNDIITVLEELLKDALAGEVQFVGIAVVDNEGVAWTVWEPGYECSPQLATQALGAVTFLNHRFLTSANDGANEY